MPFEQADNFKPPERESAALRLSQEAYRNDSMAAKAARELDVIGGGIVDGFGNGVKDVKEHPWQFAADLAASTGIMMARKGPSCLRIPAAAMGVIGACAFTKQAATAFCDVLPAIKDTWNSEENAARNKAVVKQRLGPLAFDAAAMAVAGYGAGRLGEAAVVAGMRSRIPLAHVEGRLSPEKITYKEAKVYARSLDSVVRVENHIDDASMQGTGFLASKDGLVVTALHNVEHAPVGSISVYPSNGKRFTARILEADKANDLAVLQLEAKPWQRFQPLALEAASPASDSVVLGVGYPGRSELYAAPGRFQKTVRTTDEMVTDRTGSGFTVGVDKHVIALANVPGHSGGPIMNERGRVIGVSTQNAWLGEDPRSFGIATPAQAVAELVNRVKPGPFPIGRRFWCSNA